MSLSHGNKNDDSFNFDLQKSIAQWEPSLRDFGPRYPYKVGKSWRKSSSFYEQRIN